MDPKEAHGDEGTVISPHEQQSADITQCVSDNSKADFEEELEEGEIAEEDSNDGDDFDVGNGDKLVAKSVEGNTNAATGTDKEPKKKRKRLVRVRKKIRVKKKVAKKKAAAAAAAAVGAAAESSALNEANNNSADGSSSFGQQIIMLQELRHAQILRAAATDEDLRIFAGQIQNHFQQHLQHQTPHPYPPILLLQQQVGQQYQQQQQHQVAHIATNTMTAINTMCTTMAPVPLLATSNNHTAFAPATTYALPTSHPPYYQTPSSPDDESEKSSYDAISKMLTMLRHSANDPNENSDPNDNQNNFHSQNKSADNIEPTEEPVSAELNQKDSIEYALVPILVEGIDYTKYKLLSRYEPKFKRDPRLNQST